VKLISLFTLEEKIFQNFSFFCLNSEIEKNCTFLNQLSSTYHFLQDILIQLLYHRDFHCFEKNPTILSPWQESCYGQCNTISIYCLAQWNYTYRKCLLKANQITVNSEAVRQFESWGLLFKFPFLFQESWPGFRISQI
jgi:hypothetical protein